MWVLIDTNVYLDVLENRPPLAETCRNLLDLLHKERHSTFCTSQTLRDIGYYFAKRYHSKEQGQKAQFYVYQHTSKILGIGPDDAINALFEDGADYEDALQYLSAERAHVNVIVTSNVKDYKGSPVPVYRPDELLVHLQNMESKTAD